MKKNILLLTPICLLLGACESSAPTTPSKADLARVSKVVGCPPGGSNAITIVATPGHFSVAPPNFCIDADPNQDTDIKVIFTGNHDANVITLEAKSLAVAPWLTASNPGSNPDQTTITVP